MTDGGHAATACHIALPDHYRQHDFFEFHQRDPQGVAERVVDQTLSKGLIWQGQPAALTLGFDDSGVTATLDIDGGHAPADGLAALAGRMLGLDQPIAAFEQAHAAHPQLGRLIARQRGLRVPVAASPFEALSWAVTGQQISLCAAVALRRKS